MQMFRKILLSFSCTHVVSFITIVSQTLDFSSYFCRLPLNIDTKSEAQLPPENV